MSRKLHQEVARESTGVLVPRSIVHLLRHQPHIPARPVHHQLGATYLPLAAVLPIVIVVLPHHGDDVFVRDMRTHRGVELHVIGDQVGAAAHAVPVDRDTVIGDGVSRDVETVDDRFPAPRFLFLATPSGVAAAL